MYNTFKVQVNLIGNNPVDYFLEYPFGVIL